MIREEKIEFTAKWCKYSKYKIEKKDDKIYILPDEKSKPSTYDPFEYTNEILRDLLIIGKEASDNDVVKINDNSLKYEIQSKMEIFQKLIIDFVNNYGLIGNFRYLPENYDFMDNEEIPVNLGYNKSMPANEFEKKYFCFDESKDWTHKMDTLEYFKHTGLDDNSKQKEGDRLNDIIFSKYYAETVSELLNFAEDIYNLKNLIFAYLYDNTPEDIKEMYADSIKFKTIEKAKFGYTIIDNKIKFGWKFNSLRAIIETMLLLNETNGRNQVKLCKYCGKPFIAENIRAEYDTQQCRNKANIYKSRNKKK